ncbi:MAG: helix-turn-helix domain-containing protein [Actinobacteria bacterium]|nr:helix-turn-helix domain-containing protein [Actinomycetota bacterium]
MSAGDRPVARRRGVSPDLSPTHGGVDTPPSDEDVRLLRLLSEGKSLARVARELQVSERTARRRIRELCRRIGVRTAIEAVVWAVRGQHL